MKKILSLLTVTTLATTAGATTIACGNHDHTKENNSKEIVHDTKWGLDAYKNKEVKIWLKDVTAELSEEKLKFAIWTGFLDADDSNNHQNQEKRFNDQKVKENLIIHDFNKVKNLLVEKNAKIDFELETKKNLNSKTKRSEEDKKKEPENKALYKDFTLLKSEKITLNVIVNYLA